MTGFLTRLSHGVSRLTELICLFSMVVAAIAMAGLGVIVIVQILARLMLVSLAWTMPVTGYLLVATTFFAIAPALRKHVHIRVSLILDRAYGLRRKLIEMWCYLSGLAVALYCAWWAVDQAMISYRFNEVSTDIIPFPLWPMQLIIAWGFALFALVFVEWVLMALTGRSPEVAGHSVPEQL